MDVVCYVPFIMPQTSKAASPSPLSPLCQIERWHLQCGPLGTMAGGDCRLPPGCPATAATCCHLLPGIGRSAAASPGVSLSSPGATCVHPAPQMPQPPRSGHHEHVLMCNEIALHTSFCIIPNRINLAPCCFHSWPAAGWHNG